MNFLTIDFTDIIAIPIIILIIGGALLYIIKAKKSGVKCIGCPHGKTCKNKKNSCCSGKTNCNCSHNND